MLRFHHAFLVSISCQNLRDISCSYQQQLLLTVGSPWGDMDGSVVTWVSPGQGRHRAQPCPLPGSSTQEAFAGSPALPQGSWRRAEHPGLGWNGALAQGGVWAGPTWAIDTIPKKYFQTTNSLSPEMASCKWNSRDSEKVFNRSFRKRIEECGNKPQPFLTLSESCSAMNCL